MSAAKISRPPARAALVRTVTAALEDMKAVNVKVMDVRRVTDVADCMILASGNSDRHVRSIADRVVEYAKAGGFRPLGVEGERDGEWVLVDLNDVIVHVMLPRVREFYGLEELWEAPPAPVKPRAKVKSAAKKVAAKRASGKAPAAARGKRPARKSTARPGKGSSRPRG
jgi:ribosome-associated protein